MYWNGGPRCGIYLRADVIAELQALSHVGPPLDTEEGQGYRRALEALSLSVGGKMPDDLPSRPVFLRADLCDKLKALAFAGAHLSDNERRGYMLALDATAIALDLSPRPHQDLGLRPSWLPAPSPNHGLR